MSPRFKNYQAQILKNCKELADALAKKRFRIVSGGTDTHLLLADLTQKGITGSEASLILEHANITVNKNLIPFDKRGPAVTSGIRIGSAAVTTRGMKEPQMRSIAQFIDQAIEAKDNPVKLKEIQAKVLKLTKRFPLYPQLKTR
jgi:glycine hydroxymethyltransferase